MWKLDGILAVKGVYRLDWDYYAPAILVNWVMLDIPNPYRLSN